MALYVIIPNELARDLHEPLRRHFLRSPSVRVIVERRAAGSGSPAATPPPTAGRRAEDRGSAPAAARRVVLPTPAPEKLPPEVLPHAHRLRFFTTIDSGAPGVADLESARLVAGFQSGDSSAFDELYRRHFPGIYNYARMSLSSLDQAEDVAQQVFLRALQALPRYEIHPEVPFRAWLTKIARREVLRALERHAPVEPRDPSEFASMSEVAGPDRWATKWLTLPGVAELVEELPRRQQQVLMLRYAIGLNVSETAAVISATEDAVNSLRRRALEKLRGGIEELGYAPPRMRRSGMPMRMRLKPSPVVGRRRKVLAPG
jgi:RNA polymerase sigma-70 factor (ECF subfamily)